MKLVKTSIDDLVLLKPVISKDNRGYFFESFRDDNLNYLIGDITFVQENESMSYKGVLRGLHFQRAPFEQSKLIRCLHGEILDVAVDLRKNSKTFCKYEKHILSSENKNQLFIPKGFAHGFLVLSEYAVVSYKVDSYYNPKYESGIIFNDDDLNIDWEVDSHKLLLSEKDKKLNTLKGFFENLQ